MSELNGVEVEEMGAIPDAGYAGAALEPEVLTPGQVGALARLAEDGLTEDVRLELAEHFGSVQAALAQCKQAFQEEPEEPDHEAAQAEPSVDEEVVAQIEEATAEVCQAQLELQEAEHEEEQAILAKKAASQKVEAKQEWLSSASKRLRKLREGRFPDGDKYPMFDRKAEINAEFSKPEAILPLPATDFDEYYRRKARDTTFASLVPKLKPSTLVKLQDLGLATVGLYGAKAMALGEAGADMTTVKGLTRARCEEIADAIGRFNDEVQGEWLAMHPAEAAVEGEEGGDGGIFIETKEGMIRFVPTPKPAD